MVQQDRNQYRVVKGHKAAETGFEASYEYTTGNKAKKKQKKKICSILVLTYLKVVTTLHHYVGCCQRKSQLIFE